MKMKEFTNHDWNLLAGADSSQGTPLLGWGKVDGATAEVIADANGVGINTFIGHGVAEGNPDKSWDLTCNFQLAKLISNCLPEEITGAELVAMGFEQYNHYNPYHWHEDYN